MNQARGSIPFRIHFDAKHIQPKHESQGKMTENGSLWTSFE
jgi:uncharacterized lipoprotein YbaY